MKWVILLSLLTLRAHALVLEKFIALPEGTHSQSFVLTPGSAVYKKESNYFDAKRDLQVGSFEAPAKGSEVVSARTELEALLVKLTGADELLRTQGTDLNAVAGGPGHAPAFRLEGYLIPAQSKYFDELERIFRSLEKAPWKQVSGFRLGPDLATITEIKNGKAEAPKAYAKDFYCRKLGSYADCSFVGGGKLVVSPELTRP